MEFLLKALNFYFIYDTSCKNYRNRISHYRTYRCWSRYRCSFRSSYIRCGKKPIFKRTTIFLCNFRIRFFRSYWIIYFDDGFFATLCGITVRAYRIFILCLTILIYFYSQKKNFLFIGLTLLFFFLLIYLLNFYYTLLNMCFKVLSGLPGTPKDLKNLIYRSTSCGPSGPSGSSGVIVILW